MKVHRTPKYCVDRRKLIGKDIEALRKMKRSVVRGLRYIKAEIKRLEERKEKCTIKD